MLDALTDHFIICGYGRIGGTIAEEFLRQRAASYDDRDAEKVHEIIARGGLAAAGRCEPRGVLKRVGLDRAPSPPSTDAENAAPCRRPGCCGLTSSSSRGSSPRTRKPS
ncbi:MAG: NAD-binding protein [Vicinamibacterales bacterium]